MSTNNKVPPNASFDASDEPYLCPNCNKVLLRYNAGIGKPVQVTGGDSSLASIISWEHVCPMIKHVHIPEIGLQSMQAERAIQAEFYEGQFHSTAQLKPLDQHRKATGRPVK
jgi:hypothetical protein